MLLYRADANNVSFLQWSLQTDFLWIAGAFALLMGASFIINQIQDIETDRLNRKLFFFADGHLTVRSGWIAVSIELSIGLLILYLTSPDHFILGLLFFFITGILYNLKPVPLKNTVIGGAIANLLMGVIAAMMGETTIHVMDMIAILWLSTINFCVFVWTTLPDTNGDRDSGKRTIGTALGARGSFLSTFILSAGVLAMMIAYGWIRPMALVLLSLTGLFSIAGFIRPNHVVMFIKTLLLLMALVAVTFYPFYLLLIIAAFFITRWFYQYRFGMTYPNLKNH